MHSRALRILTSLTATATAAALLTGCAGTDAENTTADPAQDGAQASSNTVGSGGQAEYDTGAYRTEPLPGWSETSDQDGPVVEMARIADNTVLPFEVDEDFTESTRVEYYDAVGKFAFDLPQEGLDRLKAIDSKFLVGYGTTAAAENGRVATNTVVRYVDPQGAKAAAEALMQTFITEGPEKILEGDADQPGFLIEVPQLPTAQAARSQNGAQFALVDTHNEYLMFTRSWLTTDSSEQQLDDDAFATASPAADAPVEVAVTPELMQWQVDYATGFVEKQTPLLDTIPAKKTEAGFGTSGTWPEVDPDDILRFTLASPTDDSVPRTYSFASAMGKRQMAGNYASVPEMLTVLDQAGVEAMAQNQTRLFRAKNKESAELLAATLGALRADGEVEYWDEPQGVPGVTCSTTFENEFSSTHVCNLVYENYFATAAVSETDYSRGEERVGDSGKEAPKVDPKTQLSQAMAAQYLILQQAPTAK